MATTTTYYPLSNHRLVALLVHRDDLLRAELVADARAGRLRHRAMPCGIGEQHHAALGHLVERVRRMQEAADAVLDHLGKPTDARRDDRHLARHRFERRKTEAFLRGWQQEQIRDRQQPYDLLLRPERVHERRDAELAREPVCRAELRPVADE